jgi:hypothetical protein
VFFIRLGWEIQERVGRRAGEYQQILGPDSTVLTAEVRLVNQYGAKALSHWRKHLPGQLAQIPDQEAFFTHLGETAADQVDQIADSLAQTAPPGEGYLEELGRLETARKTAEMQVTREMLLIDPEDPEAIAQLLG